MYEKLFSQKSILPENPCLGEQGFFFVKDYKRAAKKIHRHIKMN